MYKGQPYMNGPRHTYLDMAVKSVNPRVLGRIMDRLMGRNILNRNIDPPFLTIKYALPIYNDGLVDVTRAKQAFGRRAMPKLRRELHHPDELIVRQALNTLSDMMHDPERVYEALELRILDRLQDKYNHEDPFIREIAAMILASIAGHALGTEEILKKPKRMQSLCFLLRDVEPTIRMHASLALEQISRCCIHGLFDEWILHRLVTLLRRERVKELVAIHLQSLEYVLSRDNQKEALDLEAMDILMKMIDDPYEEVQSRVLANIALLSIHPVGRRMGQELDMLELMRPKLFDDRFGIHFPAATVIMYNTITTQTKFRALEMDFVNRLLLLAGDEQHPQLQFHCIRALTNISESPEGRKLMMTHEQTIEAIRTNGHEYLERAVATLLRVARWMP